MRVVVKRRCSAGVSKPAVVSGRRSGWGVGSEVVVEERFAAVSCRRGGGDVGRQSEVEEDLAHDTGLGDESEHQHGRSTARTGEGVEVEDAQEQLGPRQGTPAGWGGRVRQWCVRGLFTRMPARFFESVVGQRGRLGKVVGQYARRQGQSSAPARGAGEDTVVSHEVGVGGGHEGSESAQEFDGIEDETMGTCGVGPGPA